MEDEEDKLPATCVRCIVKQLGGKYFPGIILYAENVEMRNNIIGALNVGGRQTVHSIQQNIEQLHAGSDDKLGEALNALTDGILSHFSGEECNELLEQLETLSQQATLPAEQRKKGVIKPLLDSLASVCSGAGGLAAVWQTWGPAISEYFGL